MKSNIVIYSILTVFFFVVAIAYTLSSYLGEGVIEWAGSVVILLCGVLFAFVGFYFKKVAQAQNGELESDLPDADIDDGDPEIGEFSPWSWWPIMLAGSAGIFLVGLCIGGGFWLAFFGFPFLLVSIVGWVYEYYRGHFAR